MVVASPTPTCDERILPLSIPVIDMSWRRDKVLDLLVRACENYGFFKVINHGVSKDVIKRFENEGKEFFSLSMDEKKKAGPPNPLGYGSRNIGFNGDIGELEYLLLHTNPNSINQRAKSICKKDPSKFSSVVNEYVDAMRQLACEILELLGDGLGLKDKRAFSRPLKDSESDSLIRMNHYPSYCCYNNPTVVASDGSSKDLGKGNNGRVGFGEHTDPQILSILRSNDVEGLQILHSSGDSNVWVPVPSDPSAFYVHVGDTLQALTNGRFVSVRHRAMANSYSSRLSTIYFGAPHLQSRISPLPEMITPSNPRRYRSYTWSEYKKTMYSLRLSHNRLDLFRLEAGKDEFADKMMWL